MESVAAFLGSMLFCINHGLAFLPGKLNRERWIPVIATYTMPYLVNVYGQYSYRRKLRTQKAALARELDKLI